MLMMINEQIRFHLQINMYPSIRLKTMKQLSKQQERVMKKIEKKISTYFKHL